LTAAAAHDFPQAYPQLAPRISGISSQRPPARARQLLEHSNAFICKVFQAN
jgi:hypothetical protein